jgi:hypothetical protein
MAKIQINWLDAMGNIISSEMTDDDYTQENITALEEYINDTTEGLNAPEGWDQFDLIPYEEVA